jgi:hypothetical protein
MLSILAEYSLDDVLPFVGKKGTSKREYTVGEQVFNLRMTSLRLRTFKACRKCVICGLQGSTMLLEQFEMHGSPHFNLYGDGVPSTLFASHAPTVEKSNLILFTKDHILPKSSGGKDVIQNMQTMCVVCNQLKKNSSLNNKLLKVLRLTYDENLALEKKELLKLLNAKRKSLVRRGAKQRKKKKDKVRDDGHTYTGSERRIN